MKLQYLTGNVKSRVKPFLRGAETMLVFALHGWCCRFTPVTSRATTEGSASHFNGTQPLNRDTGHVNSREATLNDPTDFLFGIIKPWLTSRQ